MPDDDIPALPPEELAEYGPDGTLAAALDKGTLDRTDVEELAVTWHLMPAPMQLLGMSLSRLNLFFAIGAPRTIRANEARMSVERIPQLRAYLDDLEKKIGPLAAEAHPRPPEDAPFTDNVRNLRDAE